MKHTSKAAALITAIALAMSAVAVQGAWAATWEKGEKERFDRTTLKAAAPDDDILNVRAIKFGKKTVFVKPFERDYTVYMPAKSVADLLGLAYEPIEGEAGFNLVYDGKMTFTIRDGGPFGGVLLEDDELYADMRGIFSPLGYDMTLMPRSATLTPRFGEGFDLSTVSAVNKSFNALNNDNPIFLAYYRNATAEEQSGDKNIIALARELTDGITGDVLKARAIHDWVAGNVAYDFDTDEEFLTGKPVKTDALTVLKLRHTICFGFAKLTTALLRAAGIPAKTISGMAGSRQDWGDHGWTEAYCEGKWITIDSTWDQGGSYAGGKFQRNPKLAGREHFNMSMATLSKAHIATNYADFAKIDEATFKKAAGLK